MLHGHFSNVSEDEAEAMVVLEDANRLIVREAVEAAAIHLADLVTWLERIFPRVNTWKLLEDNYAGMGKFLKN